MLLQWQRSPRSMVQSSQREARRGQPEDERRHGLMQTRHRSRRGNGCGCGPEERVIDARLLRDDVDEGGGGGREPDSIRPHQITSDHIRSHQITSDPVSYTHLRAHETEADL
eukprot:2733069-Rhodomonas_salina.4